MDYHWGIDRIKKRKYAGVDKEDTVGREDRREDHREDRREDRREDHREDHPNGKKINNLMASESDASTRVSARGNHIFFYAGVSKRSIYDMNDHIERLNKNFIELQQKHPTIKMEPSPIYLHINSYGGSVFAAFAGVDMIQQSTIPVYTIVEGASASAGTILSVVGKKRYMRPHASMLIHQLSSWFGGKMTEIDDNYQNLEQMMKTIKDIYLENTTMSSTQLDEFLKHDLWWTIETCKSRGLIDETWTGEL